jgi:hypothetical protein
MLRAEAGPFSTLFLLELRRNWARLAVAAAVLLMASLSYFHSLSLQERNVVQSSYYSVYHWAEYVTWIAAALFPFLAMRHEWKSQTQYLLLSLPVRGRTVLVAKLLAGCVQLALLFALAGAVLWGARGCARCASTEAFLLENAHDGFTWVELARITVWDFFSLMPLYAAGFLAYVLGRTVRRFSWLVAALVYPAIFYPLYLLFRYELALLKCESLGRFCNELSLPDSLAMTIISAGVLLLAGAVWDRKLEV